MKIRFLILILLLLPIVLGVTFVPQGNIDLLGIRGIRNATSINTTLFYLNGTSVISDTNFWVDQGDYLEPNASAANNVNIPGYLNASTINTVLYVQVNNATDIQATIDNCPSTGCKVIIPTGLDYNITNQINITQNSTSIKCSGKSTRLFTESNISILYAEDKTDIIISDCWFEGMSVSDVNHSAIRFVNVNDSIIERIWANNFYYGVFFEAGYKLTVKTSHINHNHDGIQAFPSIYNSIVNGNFVSNNTGNGIILTASNTNIINNEVEQVTLDGIYFHGNSNKVIDNYIFDSSRHGIYYHIASRYNIIDNNYISTSGWNGVRSFGAYDNIISNNQFLDNSNKQNVGYSDIFFTNDSNGNYSVRNIIEGNSFAATDTNKSKYHIEEDGTMNGNNTINSNKFRGAATADYLISSSILQVSDDADNGLVVDQNYNGTGVNIDSEAKDFNSLFIQGVNDGTATSAGQRAVAQLWNAGAGNVLYATRSVASTGEPMVEFIEDHASTTADVLFIRNDGSGNYMTAGSFEIDSDSNLSINDNFNVSSSNGNVDIGGVLNMNNNEIINANINASQVNNFDIDCPSDYFMTGVNMSNESLVCQSNPVNSTFNQSLTDTLYAANGSINLTFNQSLTDTLYALNTTVSDNSSWNRTFADTLYALNTTVSDNSSWNRTFADTLYALNTTVSYNETFNQSLTDGLYESLGSVNISFNQSLTDTLYANNGSVNLTFNQSLTDTLYASVGAGNDSWNQSLADTLYLSDTGDTGTGDYTFNSGTVTFNTNLSLGSTVELTISSGNVTASRGYHSIDTEADNATDNLTNINGGVTGNILIIRPISSSRAVLVEESGNLVLNGTFNMTNARDTMTLIFDAGLGWIELSRSDNA